ncbi:MAG: putative ABC transporter permease [Clostridia bacterium]|nr:putative ABC transporter permease [Clostridia bacterium]
MGLFLILAFLFSVGALAGWCIEVIFRRFFSDANPERKWLNPGFCSGPWLPLYGFGLMALYLMAAMLEDSIPIASLAWRRTVLFTMMALTMTVIEYIAGIFLLKVYNVRLWDYRQNRFNVQGLICPLYSFFWAVLSALFYFLIYPRVTNMLIWLSRNLAFSFFIGLFYGIFLIDVANSSAIIVKLRKMAKEAGIVIHFERLKTDARDDEETERKKTAFFFPFLVNKKSLGTQVRNSVERRRHELQQLREKHKDKKSGANA